MKLTKKQIDVIIANTPDELKGQQKRFEAILGYHQKSSANWNYQAGYIRHNNIIYLL